MKFGYFDDRNKEYVITTPQTPLPWINYLGSEDFFSLVSNTAGGYSFYRDARMRRLTRYRYNNSPLDMDGHRIYIKDGDTVWNPGWQPTKTPLDSYSCRHGLGYTVVEGKKDGVTARQELFVPKGDACELDRVTVCNESAAVKELDLFSYVEFCLWDAVDDRSNFQRNYSTGEVEVEGSVIYHKTEYRERRNHYAVFWANCPVDSFDTTRDAFCGVYGGPADPQAVRAGHCSGSIAHGWAPVGALHIHLTLAPGESHSKTRAHAMMARYATDAQIDAARIALRTHWEELLSTYHLESGEEKLNRMVNIWHQYQCMVTFNMSRSASYYESGTGRGMGFRDSCQDLLGFVHIIPSRARERILDIAATQFEDGSAYHQYQPLTKKGNRDIGTGFNDDPLWLIAGTAAYLRETGDWSILEEQVPFDNDAAKAQPLMEHLRRSFNFTCTHLGPHGLPLIGRADWNDCLNLNCFSEHPGESFQITGPSEGPVAESVFIAGMFVKYGHEYAELCDHLGLDTEASAARQSIDAVEQAVLTAGWDGAWFRRCITDEGRFIGSESEPQAKIWLNTQSWSVLSGLGTQEQQRRAMNSVKKYLDTELGIKKIHPAMTTDYPTKEENLTCYNKGCGENGSVFCHANTWAIIAECMLKRPENARKYYHQLLPMVAQKTAGAERYKAEPYVYSSNIFGPESDRFGLANVSWLTGTAAWTFYAISQGILGIRPDYDGLRVDPCLPAQLSEVTVTRRFRGSLYRIHIRNLAGDEKGRLTLTVDGKPVDGCVIPADGKPGKHHVEAVIE